MHYNTIRENQYYTGMVAFFPLFPYLWKLSHLGPVGISLLNGLIYISALAWLSTIFNFTKRNLLLLASVPSLVFMFLPFSEPVFFLASTIVLAGLKKNNTALILSGLVLSGLARPVATIFIPAIMFIHYYTGDNSAKSIRRSLLMIAACAGSMLFVFLIQYFQTGEWFSFIHVQKDWGNYLRLPVFPLNSWAGGFIVRLDAIAFFFGIAAACFLIYLLIHKTKPGSVPLTDKAILFSLCYLAFLSFVILCTRGGIMNSLNRYIFCAAFFMVSINGLFQQQLFNWKNTLILFLVSGLCWLLFASYVHIQTVLKFEFLSLYLVLVLASTAENKVVKNTGYYSVFTCNIIFMMIFFHRFLTGAWVG